MKQPQPVLLPLSPPPAGAPAHAPCRTMVVVGERVGGWRGIGHCVGAVLCPAPPPPPPSPLPLQAVVGRPRAASAGRSAALAGTPSRFVWLAVWCFRTLNCLAGRSLACNPSALPPRPLLHYRFAG